MADVDVKTHAKYSASGSERWLACPGSIALSAKAPPQKDTAYSKEGTRAHECLEVFLKNGPEAYVHTRAFLLRSHPADMVAHTHQAAQEIWSRVPEGATLFAETRVDLGFIGLGMYGTADAVIVEDFGKLTVVDFKYGAGVAIDAEHNSQLAYYALGAAHFHGFNFTDVTMLVIQPRAEHRSGLTTREWTITVEELETWGHKFRSGVEACEDPMAPLQAGDWCRFCPAKTICPTISDQAFDEARLEFDAVPDGEVTVTSPKLSTLPIVDLGTALKAADKLEEWVKAVREFALGHLEEGHKIPGFKLVPKRATRWWIDEAKAAKEARKLYGDKAFSTPELLSPAQFEAVVKDKVFVMGRVEKISSGVTLAPEADKREAVVPAATEFEAMPEAPPQKALPAKAAAILRKPPRPKVKAIAKTKRKR